MLKQSAEFDIHDRALQVSLSSMAYVLIVQHLSLAGSRRLFGSTVLLASLSCQNISHPESQTHQSACLMLF